MPSASPVSTKLLADLRSGQRPLDDYLREIEGRFARLEPRVQAFMPEERRFERLQEEARQLLFDHLDPERRPPLFGLLFGVKDVFRTDGFETSGGSRLPPTELAGTEADVVTRLKRLGALVAGKTVSTEFAYFAPGPTHNPHAHGHTPGGSSSGSAAAVAAGLCPLALGTQTIGSVSRPAAFCGVVGFKPTYGTVSAKGLIPLSPSLDHVGWFTPDVMLAAAVATAVRQPLGVEPQNERRRPVLAVPTGPYLERAGDVARQHLAEIRERLAGSGYEVVEQAAFPDIDAIEDRHTLIVAAEAAKVHADWYARHAPLYEERTRELVERGRLITDDALGGALIGRARLRRELTALMTTHGIDLWLSPAAPGPAPAGLESTGDPVMNRPWTHAGLPTLTLPAGADEDGLPLGIQLTARWDRDEALLAWGRGIEQTLVENGEAAR
jgi:Asp-tRNA(Asn)/Glu-tRNA(Gln) amidotransferase A subunit family amidase